MKAPSTTVSDFDSCRLDAAHASSPDLSLQARVCLALLLALLAACVPSTPALAAEHTNVSGEYGKEGPKATGLGNSCRIAFQESQQRLYLHSDNKIYALHRSTPGTVAPVGGAFPVSTDTGKPTNCADPDLAVDQASGNIYPLTSTSQIYGYTSAGAPLGGLWPVNAGGETCGVAITNTGEVWGGNYGKQEVTKFTSAGTLVGSKHVGYPVCKIAVDPQNNDLFVHSYTSGTLTKYTAASGYVTSISFGGVGSGNPGLAINALENRIYVVNGSETLQAFDTDTAAVVETISVGGPARDVALEESTDTLFVAVGEGGSGYIKEYLGVKLPEATTGDPVGDKEVSGTADPDGAGDIVECFFEYGTTSSYGSVQNCNESLPITSPQTVHASLPSLENETTYHYRLVLKTATPGSIGKGADKTVTPHFVSRLRTDPASALTRSSATLNASFEGTGEAHTNYYFEYGTTTEYGNQTSVPPGPDIGPTATPTSLSADVTGLKAVTTYHYRVVASNSLGTSVGEDMTFTTSTAVKGLDTKPATDIGPTTATLNGELDPDGLETTFYFQYGKSINYGQVVPLPPGQDVGSTAPGTTPVSVGVEELEPGKPYHYRIVARNETGQTVATDDEIFETPQPPSVDAFSSAHVTATTAELLATINPNGEESTYRFEYGTTPDYGSVEPVPDGVLPAGDVGQPVSVQLTGLERTTYHFRVVAESKWGRTVTPDQTFNFYPSDCPNAHFRQQTGSGYLPDCRAYELVSPEVVRSTLLGPEGPSAPHASNPPRFAYSGHFGVIEGTGEPTGQGSNIYVATRTLGGWVSRYTGLRGNEGIEAQGSPDVLRKAEGPFGSRTLDRVMDWETGQQGFTCCGDLGSFSPFLWDYTGDFISRLPTNIGEIPNGTVDVTEGGFRGDGRPSADFTYYYFSSNNVAFTPDGLTTGPGSAYANNLETGEVTLISKTSQGQDIPSDTGPATEYIKIPAVSVDGSHAVMSTQGLGGTHLYLSVDASEFFDLSADEAGVNQPARFEGMTDDGGTIYLTSTAKLTADDTDMSRDLYAWNEDQDPHLTRISQGTSETGNLDSCATSWTSGCGAEMVEIFQTEFGTKKVKATDNAIAAETGEAYFYSPELLDNGKGTLGQRNLYVYRGGQPRYVTTFTGPRLANRIQVSPDGDHMAFVTAEQLTTYDNAGKEQMYSYDPATRELRCVSCIPDGTPPSFNVEASQNGLFMSDDGRTFFATQDSLVPRDANGLWDVYEYVESRPQLISSGTASADRDRFGHTGLVGVSADGIDVYFATLETLVPKDRNGPFLKFYDARTGGGFAFDTPPAPCVAADECHGPSSRPPVAPTMGTSANLGDGGNAKAVKKKSKKKKKTKKKKSKKKKDRKRTRKHGRG